MGAGNHPHTPTRPLPPVPLSPSGEATREGGQPPRSPPGPAPPRRLSPAHRAASPVPSPPPARPEAAGRFIRGTGPLHPARRRRRQTAPPPRRRSRCLMWRRPGSAAAPSRRAQGQAGLATLSGPGWAGAARASGGRGAPNGTGRPQTNLLPSPSPPAPDWQQRKPMRGAYCSALEAASQSRAAGGGPKHPSMVSCASRCAAGPAPESSAERGGGSR